MTLTYKFELINFLIRMNEYTSYLEIGLGPEVASFYGNKTRSGATWSEIICEEKMCVDIKQFSPNLPYFVGSSDDFFKHNNKVYDLIYIDGDHNSVQVTKDLQNALRSISDRGCIVLHDVGPIEESDIAYTASGDAYKSFMLARQNPLLHSFCYNFTNNDVVGIVIKDHNPNSFINEKEDYSFNFYLENRDKVCNFKTLDEIEKIFYAKNN